MLAIVKPGLLTTVQDLGRPGYAHLGVGRSGALDAPALARANELVGNPPSAAGLETTLTGVTLRAEADLTIAVTGAVAPITVDGQPVAFDAPVTVGAGAVIAAARGCDTLTLCRRPEPRTSWCRASSGTSLHAGSTRR